MEISDRRELNKLIAYSKSFRVNDIEPDFEEQVYTPPGNKHFLFEVQEEEPEIALDCELSEQQLLQQLHAYVNNLPEPSLEDPDISEETMDIVEPIQKSETTCDLTEYNKVSESFLQLLDKTKGRRSLFSENLKSKEIKKPLNSKPIKIYFFNTAKCVTLYVVKQTTVGEVLRQAIQQYQLEPTFDQSLLRYAKYSAEAYEVRILDDDYDFKADMAFAALDKKKEILSTSTNLFAIIEVANFKPNEIQAQMEKISGDKVIIFDVIVIEGEVKLNSKIQVRREGLVQEIIDTLNKKNKKINIVDYQVQLIQEEDFITLDLKQPLLQLQARQLQVIKKQWADQSSQTQVDKPKIDLQDEAGHDAPLNHIQAFKYEKFTVIKINERGKKQDRILGIDQFRIYNMNKKENLTIFEKFITNKETGTKFPERLIEDIVELRVADKFLYITFKERDEKTDKEKLKELKFDTFEAKVAQKIEKKINFIRDFQAQTQAKKLRTYSSKFD